MTPDTKRLSKNRRTFLKSTGAVGVTSLAGCLGGTGSGDGLTQLDLAIPHFGTWDLTCQFLVGREQGFFEDEGLEVERIDVGGGGENVRTVIAGDADIGFGTGISALFASYREGSDVRIVSNEIASASDIVMFSAPDSKYESLEDCDDAAIGYSRPGSSTHMVVERAIEHGELSEAEAVSVGGFADALTAVESGEIDVGWAIPFFSTPRIRDGTIQEVFTGDQIPPFDDMSIRVNFATGEWLENNPDTARAFFRAWQQSTDYAYDNLDESATMWAEMLDQDQEPLKQAIEQYYPKEYIELDRLRNVDTAMDLAVEFEFIEEVLSEDELDELLYLDYLP